MRNLSKKVNSNPRVGASSRLLFYSRLSSSNRPRLLSRSNSQELDDKRGVSEMIAYVILISIAIGLAVAVYAWLNVVTNIAKPPIDCKEGTTISLESYNCDNFTGTITLIIKNTGRFNVDGIMAKFGDNLSKEPVAMLKPEYIGTAGFPAAPTPGHFSFNLTTGTNQKVKFSRMKDDNTLYEPSGGIVKVVQIQPFIRDKRKIACIGTVIKELFSDSECKIVP